MGAGALGRSPIARFALGFTLALTLLLLVAAYRQPSASIADWDRDATPELAALSLMADGDLAYGPADRARGGEGVGRFVTLGRTEREISEFGRGTLYSVLTAPARGLAGRRGALTLSWLAFGLALSLAAWRLRPRLGDQALPVSAVAAFGSATFVHLFSDGPGVLALLLVVAALSLVDAPSSEPPREPEGETLFGDESDGLDFGRLRARWVGAGALLACVGLMRPAWALLVVALAGFAPPSKRRAALGWAVLGALVALAGGAAGRLALGGEPLAGLVPVERLLLDGGARVDLAPGWAALLSPTLLAWNALFLIAGRSIGLLVYFLPVVLLVAASSPGRRRRALASAAALAAGAQLFAAPYALAGEVATVGSQAFLPIYGALWFLPTRPLTGRWAVVALLAAFLVLPSWRFVAASAAGRVFDESLATPAGGYLPIESTQRFLPCGRHGRVGPRVRAVWFDCAAPGDPPALRRGAVELLLVSERPLERVLLSFGRRARNELDVDGAELVNVIFRPTGRVDFEIGLGEPRRHRAWAQPGDRHYHYPLRIRMPDLAEETLPFKIRDPEDRWSWSLTSR